MFKDYYTLFRGKGYTLTNTNRRNISGLYNSLIDFFTAQYVFIYDLSGKNELVTAHQLPQTKVIHTITKSIPPVLKEDKSFVVSSSIDNIEKKDFLKYDLSIYHFSTEFPSDRSSSVDILKEHLDQILEISQRLMMGGFLVLVLSRINENLDLILSSIEVVTGSLASLTYNGMIMFDPLRLPIWIFRREPMNKYVIPARVNMARKRLRRYINSFTDLIDNMAPPTASSSSLRIGEIISEPLFLETLRIKITPSHTLNILFDILQGAYPREIINAVTPYQIKYEQVLSSISLLASKNVLLSVLNEMLYDFALSLQRRLISRPTTDI